MKRSIMKQVYDQVIRLDSMIIEVCWEAMNKTLEVAQRGK